MKSFIFIYFRLQKHLKFINAILFTFLYYFMNFVSIIPNLFLNKEVKRGTVLVHVHVKIQTLPVA
jgi:hypothetical protein